MEELQDAIEDAQYVNAISTQEDGPRPVLAWEIPSEEQVAGWKERVGTQQGVFELDHILQSAIGLFQFSAFLKDTCNDYLRINFCEEVLRWRRLRGRQRVEKARKMISGYLSPPRKDDLTGELVLPQKTEIDEFDLERPHTKRPDMEVLFAANYDESNKVSCLGLDGEVRETILAKMQAVEQARAAKRDSGIAADATGNGLDAQDPADDDHAGDEEGPPVNQFPKISDLKSTETMKSSHQFRLDRKQPSGPRYLPDDFFDDAEAVVMESLRRQFWSAFQGSEQFTKLLHFLWYQDRRVIPEDFFVMRVLGRGGFGLVTGTNRCVFDCDRLVLSANFVIRVACKKGTSGKLYAMKVMNKRRIKMKKSEQLALNERAALAAVESPFVVNLKYSFHSKDDVYLILDLMTGGDLGYHLHQKGRFPKKECLYYAARIMLGLQALHDKQYVYRDLKPENCLLADDGRVKITDLGLATKITPTLHGAAGTRGYWAPEMLRRDRRGKRMPYGHTVDWFSFGCCLAEFISGQNPFRSEAALNFGLDKGKQSKVG